MVMCSDIPNLMKDFVCAQVSEKFLVLREDLYCSILELWTVVQLLWV